MKEILESSKQSGKTRQIPPTWSWTTLENCVQIFDGQRVPINRTEREGRKGDIPYYGATGQVGWIDDYLFDEELLLLGEDGCPFLEKDKNKAYIIRGKSWVNNHAHVLKALSELTSNSYLCHYLNTFDYTEYVNGTTRLKLNQARLKEIPIPIAPYCEQNRIVTKIEEIFTQLDSGIEYLKKTKMLLKRYRKSILKYAFEGKLTEKWRERHQDELESILIDANKTNLSGENEYDDKELPKGWIWMSVKNVGEIVTGRTPSTSKREYYGKDYPFFKPTDLNAGYYVEHSADGLSKKGINEVRLLPSKSILVTCIGATIGKTGFTRVPGASNQQINAIIPKDVIPEYIYFLFISPQIFDTIIKNASSTTLPIINKSKFEKISLPIPSLQEQAVIVKEIERLLLSGEDNMVTVDNSLLQSYNLRRSVLKTAFEGRLVAQSSDDESGEILLQRIGTITRNSEIYPNSNKTKIKAHNNNKRLI